MSGAAADAAPVTRREIRTVYFGLMITLSLSALDQSIVTTALPRIVSDFGGVTHLSWVVTAYVLTSTATMPLYGKLSDQYGRKPLLYAAVLIFLIGSLLCGFAQGMVQLIVFRAIQGLGAGGLLPLAQSTIGDLVPPKERGRRQGMIGAVFAISSVAGPLVGGAITDLLSWHWIFLINLPVGAASLMMIAIALRRPFQVVRRRIDYSGAALLAAATAAFLLALSLGGTEYAWTSPVIAGWVGAAVVLTVLFVRHERITVEPVLPLHLFSNRVFLVGCTVLCLTFMGLLSASVFFPLFFQVVLGIAAAKSGLFIGALMGGLVAAAFTNGRVLMRTGRYKPAPVAGLGLAAVAFAVLTWSVASAQGLPVIELALALAGFGLGFVTPSMTVAVQNAVPRDDLGAATATLAFFRSLGGVVGVAASGAILNHRLHELLHGRAAAFGIDADALLKGGVEQVAALAPVAHAAVVDAYRTAIATTFLLGVAAIAVAFLVIFRLPELPLHARNTPPA